MRMRYLGAVLTLLTVLITAVSTASAQPPAPGDELCYPDCPESTWLGYWEGLSHEMPISCGVGCRIRVFYVKRTPCSTADNDVQIYRIEFTDGDCSGCDYGTMIREALIQMLSGNAVFPHLDAGQCTENRRVSIADCWKKISIPSRQIEAIRPCLDGPCCVARYKVCKDAANHVSIETIESPTTNPACQNDPEQIYVTFPFNPNFNDVTAAPCTSVCEEILIDLHKPTGDPQLGLPDGARIIETRVTTTITLRLEDRASALLELFDAVGARVREIRPEVEGIDGGRFTIDRAALPSGMYHYRITDRGKQLTAGEIRSAR